MAIRRETERVTTVKSLTQSYFMREMAACFPDEDPEAVQRLLTKYVQRAGGIKVQGRFVLPLNSFLTKHQELKRKRDSAGTPHSIGILQNDLDSTNGSSENMAKVAGGGRG